MRSNKEKAAALTTASTNNQQIELYRNRSPQSSLIDEILAGLLFGLLFPHLTSPERRTVLDVIDGLLRLKIDIKGVRFG